MRRADRLFQIVQHLRGGRLLTAGALAERLEVSPRTIYRDIADLQGSGVPIEGEAGVGYVMAQGYDVPPLMFTRDEVAALVAGARMTQAFAGQALASAAQEALVKIEAVLPSSLQEQLTRVGFHATPFGINEDIRQKLDALESAAARRVRLSLRYLSLSGAETTRDVRPLGVWFWGQVWTLVTWCELRGDFRTFRVDRIQTWQEGDTFPEARDKSLHAFYKRQEALDRGTEFEAKR